MKKPSGPSKTEVGKILSCIARYIFLTAFAYILLYPLLFIIANSLKGPADYFDPTVEWVPKLVSFSNYSIAAGVMKFGKSLKNTLVIMIVSSVIEIFSCAFAAYGLARFNFRGKRVLSVVMIITILVPSAMIMLPSYLNFRYTDLFGILGFIGRLTGKELRLNLLDTPFVFWIPSVFAVGLKGGLFIYIYSQFYKGLPKEFEEAAYIDGAGPVRTYFSIILKASAVPMVTVSLFSVVWHWNEYYLSSLYLSNKPTLSVSLYTFADNINAYYNGAASNTILTGPAIMAGCVMFVLPMIAFYLVLQRKFVSSIANSGIVG